MGPTPPATSRGFGKGSESVEALSRPEYGSSVGWRCGLGAVSPRGSNSIPSLESPGRAVSGVGCIRRRIGRRPRQPPPRGAAIGGLGPGSPACRACGGGGLSGVHCALKLLRDMEVSCRYMIFDMRCYFDTRYYFWHAILFLTCDIK